MAAPKSRTQANDTDSSSSDDEQRERLKEAAWLPPGVKQSIQPQQDPVAPIIPSLRAQPDRHEHDGNELQTTPEFRAHVAKKLAAILDSCIKVIPQSSSLKDPKAESEVEDEGFRLFSTSVPGDTGTAASNSLPKRRAAYSSSSEDSEEENRRCREAAVSGLDILKHSALPTVPVETSHTPSHDHIAKKHKKKKKKDGGEGTESEQQEIMQDHNGLKKKKNKHLGDTTESEHQGLQHEQEPNSFNKKKKKKDVVEGTESEQQEIMQDHVSNGLKKKKNKHLGDTAESEHQGLQHEQEPNSLKKNKKKKHKWHSDDTESEQQELRQELCGIKKIKHKHL